MLKIVSCITKVTFVFFCANSSQPKTRYYLYIQFIFKYFDIALTKNLHSECDEGNLGEEFNDKDMKRNPSRASSGKFEIFAKANDFYLGHHRVSYLSPPLNDIPFVEIHPPQTPQGLESISDKNLPPPELFHSCGRVEAGIMGRVVL